MTKGEIYIVSTGIGKQEYLTCNALNLLNKSELIVGYGKYLKDIEQLISGKEIYSTGMTHEVERCKYALEQAVSGRKVALISNGDANIYGMAGLVLEIIDENNLWDKLEVYIEPGITTLLAAAAKSGAPIMNDFAVVSLSNLLTPLETIEKRLQHAFIADFVVGIYNPLSHSRTEPYQSFLKILADNKNPETPIIIAQNLGRDNEKIWIKTVADLLEIGENLEYVNMSSILIIGNSTTKIVHDGRMVITRRGYQQAYDYSL